MKRPEPRRARTLMLLAVVGLTTLAASGCQIAHAVTSIAFPPRTDARYELVDRPTVVVIDDPRELLGTAELDSLAADQAGIDLQREGLVTTLVPPGRVADIEAANPEQYKSIPVDRLGRMVDAEQVIYAVVESVVYEEEPGLLTPTARARVKVIDAVESRRLWPTPMSVEAGETIEPIEGALVTVELPVRPSLGFEPAHWDEARRELAIELGRGVAKVFYKHLDDP